MIAGEGRGTEWGRHFRYTWPRRRLCTLFGTSQSWLAFRFESTVVLVPLVNASRIVPTLIPCARNFIFLPDKILQNFSQTSRHFKTIFFYRDSAKLRISRIYYYRIVDDRFDFSIYDGDYERLCPGIHVDTFQYRIFKRNVVANYRGEKVTVYS